MAPKKWSMGILNDRETEEVPGSILLIPQSQFQEPLGFPEVEPPAAQAADTAPPTPSTTAPPSSKETSILSKPQHDLKRTPDGKFVLDPQPDDNPNDPLNWSSWRRDLALLSLGWHCLVGGGQTPVLAAGFGQVADDFGVTYGEVALTTGLFMMGLGVGSLFSSPLAILYGKRPVYLGGVALFLASALWAAAAKSYASLVVARVVMGLGISPCESLPSATIAEIFFLHERAYRVGIYTLLLLGGKNLVPLVSAVVINSEGWRWVFWIVSIIVGVNLVLLFFLVPETFWDRTPHRSTRPSLVRRGSSRFAASLTGGTRSKASSIRREPVGASSSAAAAPAAAKSGAEAEIEEAPERRAHFNAITIVDPAPAPPAPAAQQVRVAPFDMEKHLAELAASGEKTHKFGNPTTTVPKTYFDSLRPWNGRLREDSFLKAMRRPMILYLYPAILWSTVVYSLSVGWLIVLSESVAHIYQHKSYHFTPLQTGLVYLSPFIGGVLGTAVAGKLSDVIVRFMARRNNGIYEPEFRLVMGIPILFCTAIGLMGFGWSAEKRDNWIVPTLFFGIISFGCSLGSTTAITFAVDSYRQFAGEALVTLNFSKNIFHGLVFSLFFNNWLESQGSRKVFLALGGVQVACLLATIPLYIYGKRARMWTVRKNFAGRWS